MKLKPFYSTMQMIGIKDNDIPKFLINFKDGLENALYRINTIIDDEWINIIEEEQSGIDVDSYIDWNGNFKISKNEITSNNLYPGNRKINDFENIKINDKNFWDYTYESMVFSFAVLAALGKTLEDNNDTKLLQEK